MFSWWQLEGPDWSLLDNEAIGEFWSPKEPHLVWHSCLGLFFCFLMGVQYSL